MQGLRAPIIAVFAGLLLAGACARPGADPARAAELLGKGEREAAARAVRGLVPRRAEDWRLLERIYSGLPGFEDEAVQAFRPLGESGDPQAVLLAVRVALSVDRADVAARWLKKARDRRPEDDALLVEQAKLFGRQGRHREAIALLAPRAGSDPRKLNLLGYEWLLAGDDARAEAFLERAVEEARAAGRPYAPPHYHLGLLYSARGEPARALAEFERALAANPRHLEASYQTMVVAERLGLTDRLQASRERFAELYRQRLEARGALDPEGEIDETGEPIYRGVSWEKRRIVDRTEFARTLPAGARVGFACLAPKGKRAQFDVVAGGKTLLNVLLEGDADEGRFHPCEIEIPGESGRVEVHFHVGPVGLVSRLVGRRPPDDARFSEPVVLSDPARRSADPRPNVILVSLDTLRADHTSVGGASRETSPALERLAREGVRFARAEAPSNWTLPSHYSIFSGLTPAAHGVLPDLGELRGYLHPDRKLALRGSGAETMLAEALTDLGYRAVAVTENGWVSAKFGFDQGFDLYRSAPAGSLPGTLAASLAELRRHGSGGPWFLFVHTYAPHQPYHAPRRFRTRWTSSGSAGFAWPAARVPIEEYNRFRLGPLFPPTAEDIATFRDLYDGQVAWADTLVDGLLGWLDEAGMRRQTLVVVTSDHGEELFERGQFDHGDTLFEEVTHVPLVFSWPGRLPEDRAVAQPVSLVDVAATILDLAGGEPNLGFGKSLRPRWEQDEDSSGSALFAEATGHGGEPLRAVWFEGFKLIRRETGDGPVLRCFDLRRDPGERINLAETDRCPVSRLEALLDAHLERAAQIRETLGTAEGELDDESRERLRGLGYVQ